MVVSNSLMGALAIQLYSWYQKQLALCRLNSIQYTHAKAIHSLRLKSKLQSEIHLEILFDIWSRYLLTITFFLPTDCKCVCFWSQTPNGNLLLAQFSIDFRRVFAYISIAPSFLSTDATIGELRGFVQFPAWISGIRLCKSLPKRNYTISSEIITIKDKITICNSKSYFNKEII